jgi:Fur family ferric uptake transcriptional regulator
MAYLTRQRQILGEVFERANRPLTATEICQAAKRKMPSLGIATVYRAISQFLSAGRIRLVEIPGVAPHYERADRHHHHFFLCEQCKRLFDLIGCVRGLGSLAPNGFRVREHEIVLYGHCATCAVKSSAL